MLKLEAPAMAEWLRSVELVNLHELVVGHLEMLRFGLVSALTNHTMHIAQCLNIFGSIIQML